MKEVRKLAKKKKVTPIPPAPYVRDELFELGQALMFDKILSGNKNISCMTCHHTTLLSDDDRHLALGEGGFGVGAERVGGDIHVRNSLAFFNLHALDHIFLDMRVERHGNRVKTPAGDDITRQMQDVFEFGPLSAVGLFPVIARDEMRGQRFRNNPDDNELDDNLDNREVWAGLMARLGEIPEYVQMFEAAYPGTPFEEMTFAHASNAMAGFMIRGFEARNSPWQQFLHGDDNALTQQQLEGARAFLDEGCANCHNGPMLTDQKAHNTGLAQFGIGRGVGPWDNHDFGRAGITWKAKDMFAFRTSPLVNITLTGPWGHAGQFSSLRDFVMHYSDPAEQLRNYDMAAQIHPSERYLLDMRVDDPEEILANLDPNATVPLSDVDAVVAFLESLTDPASADQSHLLPASVPSGLPVDDGPVPYIGGQAQGSVTFADIARDPASGLADYRRVPSERAAIADYYKELSKTEPLHFLDIFETPLRWRGMPGVAIFDYDGDGDEDLYVTNGPGAPNSLFRNQLVETGTLTFVDVAAAAGVTATDTDTSGVCYGDIDNDGDHDLYVVADKGRSYFFLNNGDGTFTDISLSSNATVHGTGGTSCAFGDIDGDGLIDLFVARAWHQENVHACFTTAFEGGIQHNELYRNLGNGVFTDVSNTSGIRNIGGLPAWALNAPTITWSVSFVDYDLDGDVDIFTADDQCAFPNSKIGGFDRGFLQIFDNDGHGNFTNRTVEAGTNAPSAWMGLSFGDFNADGYLDFFSPSFGDWGKPFAGAPIVIGDETSRWYLGAPDKTFVYPTVGELKRMPFGWGTVARDFDNDGDTDLSFHGGLDLWFHVDKSNPGTMLLNDGNANFGVDFAAYERNHSRRNDSGVAAGDLDGDGFPDIVSVSNFDIPERMPLVQYAGLDNEILFFSVFDPYAYLVPTFEFIGAERTRISQDQRDKDPTHNPASKIDRLFRWNENFVYSDGTLAVELNSAANDNHWVSLRLIGAVGLIPDGRVNRDALGAMLTFTPDGGSTVMAPVLGGSSHLSQDSLTQGFGLGSATTGTADILWPGGVRNRLYDVGHGERLVLPELPCSYDTPDPLEVYAACVDQALSDLAAAQLVDVTLADRMRSSAIRAWNETH